MCAHAPPRLQLERRVGSLDVRRDAALGVAGHLAVGRRDSVLLARVFGRWVRGTTARVRLRATREHHERRVFLSELQALEGAQLQAERLGAAAELHAGALRGEIEMLLVRMAKQQAAAEASKREACRTPRHRPALSPPAASQRVTDRADTLIGAPRTARMPPTARTAQAPRVAACVMARAPLPEAVAARSVPRSSRLHTRR